jgi:hypothetical protein
LTFPFSTGPDVLTKSTTYDVSSNTSNFFNGKDWNDLRTLVRAMRSVLVGSYRGFCERRSAGTLTALRVHTAMYLADGYRKTVASARVLIPGVTGTTYVWIRGNPTGVAGVVKTAATEPAPYATATRDFPIAKVVISGGAMTITSERPDWVLGIAR